MAYGEGGEKRWRQQVGIDFRAFFKLFNEGFVVLVRFAANLSNIQKNMTIWCCIHRHRHLNVSVIIGTVYHPHPPSPSLFTYSKSVAPAIRRLPPFHFSSVLIMMSRGFETSKEHKKSTGTQLRFSLRNESKRLERVRVIQVTTTDGNGVCWVTANVAADAQSHTSQSNNYY